MPSARKFETKGNVLDPLSNREVRTDAVRFALAISARRAPISPSAREGGSYGLRQLKSGSGQFILMNLQNSRTPAKCQLTEAIEPIPGLGFNAAAALKAGA